MNQRLIVEIGKSQRLRIVNRLKRTQGLSVGELAQLLEMSYMGVKQHCIDLDKRGYLDTWRRPKPVGRPELVYRLTEKAHELFPLEHNETMLELLRSAHELYGPSADEKLLFMTYQRKAALYIARMDSVQHEPLASRVLWFAQARDAEGYMSEFETEKKGHAGLCIVEHHSPIAGLLQAYPALIGRLEQELFAKVLKTEVKRTQNVAKGLYACIFDIGTPAEA